MSAKNIIETCSIGNEVAHANLVAGELYAIRCNNNINYNTDFGTFYGYYKRDNNFTTEVDFRSRLIDGTTITNDGFLRIQQEYALYNVFGGVRYGANFGDVLEFMQAFRYCNFDLVFTKDSKNITILKYELKHDEETKWLDGYWLSAEDEFTFYELTTKHRFKNAAADTDEDTDEN